MMPPLSALDVTIIFQDTVHNIHIDLKPISDRFITFTIPAYTTCTVTTAISATALLDVRQWAPALEAVDWYHLPTGRSAANPPAAVAAVHWRDRQTDGRTNTRPLHRPCCAYYAVSSASVDAWRFDVGRRSTVCACRSLSSDAWPLCGSGSCTWLPPTSTCGSRRPSLKLSTSFSTTRITPSTARLRRAITMIRRQCTRLTALTVSS